MVRVKAIERNRRTYGRVPRRLGEGSEWRIPPGGGGGGREEGRVEVELRQHALRKEEEREEAEGQLLRAQREGSARIEDLIIAVHS